MEPVELVDVVMKAVDEAERAGQQQIAVEALRGYLAQLRDDATDSMDLRRRSHESSLAHYNATTQFDLEMLRSVLETGKHAIQALFLLNGGAVIAMLGALSNLAGKPNGDAFARYLGLPLLQFGIGALLASVCFALRYFSQDFYANTPDDTHLMYRAGNWLKILAIFTGITGFVMFGFGLVNSYLAVRFSFAY